MAMKWRVRDGGIPAGQAGPSPQVSRGRARRPGRTLRLLLVASLALAGQVVSTATPANAAYPGFNGRIVFASERDGNRELYTINPDGSNLIRLTNHPARDSSPQWSPDGRRIAFSSNRDDGQFDDVFVMNANGSDVQNVTAAIGGGGISPTWSPDGQRIAYSSGRDGRGGEIYVLTLLTGTVQRLTTDACVRFVGGVVDESCEYSFVTNSVPSWSPDGQLIAFRKGQGSSSAIWVMNADGSNQHILNNNAFHANHVDWAPDGQRLAYSDHSQSVQIVNRDGSGEYVVPNTRQCVPGECFVLQQPSWSPDGSLLVAATTGSSVDAPGLYVFTPQGERLTRILADDSRDVARPHWQPLRIPALPADVALRVCAVLQAMESPQVRAVLAQLDPSLGCH